MDQQFTASETRRELSVRLTEVLSTDDSVAELVSFLRDDLAYAPDSRSIIGPVLREHEFRPWQDLMEGVQWDAPWPIEYDAEYVRALSRKLLTEMDRT